VRQSAIALGYVYNRRAADLRRKSSNMVGIVINDLGNPFFAEMLVGMERAWSMRLHQPYGPYDERLDVRRECLLRCRSTTPRDSYYVRHSIRPRAAAADPSISAFRW